jgi:hypothetical protein
VIIAERKCGGRRFNILRSMSFALLNALIVIMQKRRNLNAYNHHSNRQRNPLKASAMG